MENSPYGIQPVPPAHSEGRENVTSPAASLQPPVPGQMMPPPMQSPLGVPKGASSNAANFSFNGNLQSLQKDQSLKSNPTAQVAQESSSGAPSAPTFVSQPAHTTSSTVSSTPNMAPPTFWMPTAPSFQVPQGLPAGAPRIAPSVPLSSTTTVPSASVNINSSSPAVLRPIMQASPVPPSPAVQHQSYPPYQAPMAVNPQGLWLPPQQYGGLPRPPLLSYPPPFPGPFPLPTHSFQPPGVTPMGPPSGTTTPAVAVGNQLAVGSGMQPELPPGVDNSKHANDVSVNMGSAVSEQLDAWTAHRTESGAVYYYNALTGESTYEKPAGFKGQPDKVIAQPTPISWEKLAGTDWALVTTNDGKKYYYNTKTKCFSNYLPYCYPTLTWLPKFSTYAFPFSFCLFGLWISRPLLFSSLLIPNPLKRKKQDDADGGLKEQSMSVPNSNNLSDKGSASAPISLSAPAVNTGGRDATALRTTSVVPSSALDLIKKKLQDPGAPATSSPVSTSSGAAAPELNGGSRAVVDGSVKGQQSENNSKDKLKDANGDDGNFKSETESIDHVDTIFSLYFNVEMLKERGVAPFSKWEKELPKIVFDPRFKAIPGYSARRALFEHYVRTRAEEERKEKRAAQKAAIEGFKQLLEEAKEDINHNTDYQTFRRKWGSDPRFEAIERKEREVLLNERVLPLKKAAQEKAQAERAAAVSSFMSMLRDKGDITTSSRWSKMKDGLRNDPRYKSVKHEDREALFNEYISELKSAEEEAERVAKAKREEEEKLKERERALRKRKEREEQEVERVRSKARRKEAVESYQALLVETIKDPQVSWTESKAKLEKDPQGRAANPYLDQSDFEKLFREHVKLLHERCVHEFRTLLTETITAEAAAQETEDGKTVFNSWSTAKRLLKADTRYAKMPRKERESLWRRHVDEVQRRQQKLAAIDKEAEKSYKRKR
ncbi:hypothetical protein LguiA_008134 [Lonicera macranthoides]